MERQRVPLENRSVYSVWSGGIVWHEEKAKNIGNAATKFMDTLETEEQKDAFAEVVRTIMKYVCNTAECEKDISKE